MEGIEDLKREINQRGGKKTMLYVEVYLKIRDQNNEIQGKIKRRRWGFIWGTATAKDGVATSVLDIGLPCNFQHAFQLRYLNTATSAGRERRQPQDAMWASSLGAQWPLPRSYESWVQNSVILFSKPRGEDQNRIFCLSNPSPARPEWKQIFSTASELKWFANNHCSHFPGPLPV